MATRPHTITDDDVAKGLQLYNLLKVCHGAAERLSDQLERDSSTQNLAGALPGAIGQAIEIFWDVQNVIETAHTRSVLAETPAAKPNRPAGSTIADLCRQWRLVQAKLNVDILERGNEQETIEWLHGPARERSREIEEAILATDPDILTDDDLWQVLDLARELIKPDAGYDLDQEARGHEMLDLVRSALTRRDALRRLQS